jgi:hypothetical protein
MFKLEKSKKKNNEKPHIRISCVNLHEKKHYTSIPIAYRTQSGERKSSQFRYRWNIKNYKHFVPVHRFRKCNMYIKCDRQVKIRFKFVYDFQEHRSYPQNCHSIVNNGIKRFSFAKSGCWQHWLNENNKDVQNEFDRQK